MKYLGYILAIIVFVYFKLSQNNGSAYANASDSTYFLQSRANLDSLNIGADTLLGKLSESDGKVVEKVKKVGDKIVELKTMVTKLTNEVTNLKVENATLKKTISNIVNDNGSEFKLLPISKNN